MTEETKVTAPAVEEKTQQVKPQEEKTQEVETVSEVAEKKQPVEENAEEAPLDKQAVIKQVEFYFSDANLPNDKFLWRLVQSNPEGYVTIASIAQFSRMKKYRPVEAVVQVLKESNVLEVSPDGTMIRRKEPLVPPNDEQKNNSFQRSIYAKGFPVEETSDLQVELENYFEQFGKVNQVRLRRGFGKEKPFKGSVFVEFEKIEEADGFLKAGAKYNDTELLTMSKPAYVEMKEAENKFKKGQNRKYSGRGRGKYSGRVSKN